MKLKETIDKMDKVFHILSAITFICVGFCVMTQVITRYTPGISASWTDELTRLFFLYSVMLGAPMAIKYNEYAVIDIVTSNVKGKVRKVLDFFINLVVAIIAGVGMVQAKIFFQSGLRSVSTSLLINMGLFYVVPLLIFALSLAYCLIKIIGMISDMAARRKLT